jgi:hypothetical protein
LRDIVWTLFLDRGRLYQGFTPVIVRVTRIDPDAREGQPPGDRCGGRAERRIIFSLTREIVFCKSLDALLGLDRRRRHDKDFMHLVTYHFWHFLRRTSPIWPFIRVGRTLSLTVLGDSALPHRFSCNSDRFKRSGIFLYDLRAVTEINSSRLFNLDQIRSTLSDSSIRGAASGASLSAELRRSAISWTIYATLSLSIQGQSRAVCSRNLRRIEIAANTMSVQCHLLDHSSSSQIQILGAPGSIKLNTLLANCS